MSSRIGPVDLVVGIPRSGMLAASLYALHTNTPLADPASYEAGQDLGHGRRAVAARTGKRVLFLDDSVLSGYEMSRIRTQFGVNANGTEHVYAAPFVSRANCQIVDFYDEIIEPPRIFEWNVFHHPALERACCDIDGVLCPDPPVEEGDDEGFQMHLANVDCLLRPSVRIGFLVTNRLEKHRAVTERWLAEQAIEYDRLFMRPESSAEERRRHGGHGEYKAQIAKRVRASFFIESELRQAQTIANTTGGAVFCTDVWDMRYPGQSIGSRAPSRPSSYHVLMWSMRARAGIIRQAATQRRRDKRGQG
jgi:uncharacterized HAD superfamily protein